MFNQYDDIQYPFVARMFGMGNNGRLKLMVEDGRAFMFDASEITDLHERFLTLNKGLDHWLEIGVHRNGQLYVELLLTEEDFDAYQEDARIGMMFREYDEWKNKHAVPMHVAGRFRLYYDSLHKGILSNA